MCPRFLSTVFDPHVPSEIIKRKKTGFPLPYESWQRTSLKDFVSDVLLDDRTLQRGYFSKKAVQRLIADNLADGNYGKEIFSLISLELWHRTFVDKSCTTAQWPRSLEAAGTEGRQGA